MYDIDIILKLEYTAVSGTCLFLTTSDVSSVGISPLDIFFILIFGIAFSYGILKLKPYITKKEKNNNGDNI